MIDFHELIRLAPTDRKKQIDAELVSYSVPKRISKELRDTYLYSQVVNTFIKEYIKEKVRIDLSRSEGSILNRKNLEEAIASEFSKFITTVITTVSTEVPNGKITEREAKNLYELAGARKLAISNNVTRTLSTKMGTLWERLANISPYAINPEIEFNIKLTGIDVILLNKTTDQIEYAQFKTQENTLTGSQKNRSVSELLLHAHPIFCACFKTMSPWTFSHPKIPRLAGAEVWERIEMDYSIVLESTKGMLKTLESEYVRLIS